VIMPRGAAGTVYKKKKEIEKTSVSSPTPPASRDSLPRDLREGFCKNPAIRLIFRWASFGEGRFAASSEVLELEKKNLIVFGIQGPCDVFFLAGKSSRRLPSSTQACGAGG